MRAGTSTSGKICVIFDGSTGWANAHIQRNTAEKTTGATVMDNVHVLRWLGAAKKTSRPMKRIVKMHENGR